MASAIGIIWSRLMHDLFINEHEFTLRELEQNETPQFSHAETDREKEERLHVEIPGDVDVQREEA